MLPIAKRLGSSHTDQLVSGYFLWWVTHLTTMPTARFVKPLEWDSYANPCESHILRVIKLSGLFTLKLLKLNAMHILCYVMSCYISVIYIYSCPLRLLIPSSGSSHFHWLLATVCSRLPESRVMFDCPWFWPRFWQFWRLCTGFLWWQEAEDCTVVWWGWSHDSLSSTFTDSRPFSSHTNRFVCRPGGSVAWEVPSSTPGLIKACSV